MNDLVPISMACSPVGELAAHHERCNGWVYGVGRCGCTCGHAGGKPFHDTLYARTWRITSSSDSTRRWAP